MTSDGMDPGSSDLSGGPGQRLQNQSGCSADPVQGGSDPDEVRRRTIENLAHQVRTPLSLLIGVSERVSSENPSPEKTLNLRTLATQATVVHEHLERILALSLWPGQDFADPIDAVSQLNESVENQRSFFADKHIEVALAGAQTAPVMASRSLLKDIFETLIRSQAERTSPGKPMLFSVRVQDDGQTTIEIDSFHESVLEESRGQAHDAGDVDYVIGVARALGGDLNIVRSPQGATKVLLRLRSGPNANRGLGPQAVRPRTGGDQDATAPGRARAEGEVQRAPLVLAIEDDDELREFLERILSPDYRVVTFPDGPSGLDAARQLLPDLILCDLVLPGRSGESVVAELAADPDLGTTPVVVVTGKREGALPTRLLQGGADDYVSKPFVATELKARVSNLVRSRLSEQDLRLKLEDAHSLADQLQYALDARVIIEQAKGVIAGERGISPTEAFELLRKEARSKNKKLRDVATEVLERGHGPQIQMTGNKK